ncbi:MAG: hypothetical protein OXF11_09665 [Deltaproteobacteria bacterium]|nr:hypothetical protein [Deltaproteobacteria bacterium]
MTIKSVTANNRRRCFEIATSKGPLTFPYMKLDIAPSRTNRVKEVYVDRELANQAITYVLESGEEDSVHVDDFLNYNKDPDYMRDLTLYKLTLKAGTLLKESKLPKRELARRLATSPAQIYRLLDPTNYKKTIDQMVRLLACLDYTLDFVIEKDGRSAA